MNSEKGQRGFGLIEVLVAIVVVGIGVVGLMALQKAFLRSSDSSIAQNIAMQLAEEKLEEFRRFDAAVGGTSNYSDVVTGSDSVTFDGLAYSRSWTVSDYYYDEDGTPTWSSTAPSGAPYSDQKVVQVTVSWEGPDGSDSLSISTSLSSSSTADVDLFINPDPPGDGPQVPYTPGAAPDVIAVELDTTIDGNGDRRETSKPVPEISQQGNFNIVKFDTVTYDDQSGTLVREDYLTLNCECSYNGTTSAQRPHVAVLTDGELDIQEGGTADKSVGDKGASNEVPEMCSKCCFEHHDEDSPTDLSHIFDPYRPQADEASLTPHGHYSFDGSSYDAFSDYSESDFTTITSDSSDPYMEACRLQRIDGFYEVMQDWQLVDLVIMRQGWLNDSTNLATYQDYVLDVVQAHVTGSAAPSKSVLRENGADAGTVTLNRTGTFQFMARAIYVDRLSATDLTTVTSAISGGASTWPAMVPFYEVNVTLLADWKETIESDGITVSSEDVSTISDPTSGYYGTYSRGLVEVSADNVSAEVTARLRKSNTGLTASMPIDAKDANERLSDSVVVSLPGGITTYTVSGLLYCLEEGLDNKNVKTQVACGEDTLSNSLTVKALDSSGSVDTNVDCSITVPNGKNTPSFTCEGFTDAWTGTIEVQAANNDFSIYYPANDPNSTPLAIAISGASVTGQCMVAIDTRLTQPASPTCPNK
ncbi:prepilin-type N-terminal cleavage/methylation domain-containing protein [Gallaecimonas sp. GXIMD4217]|uniref:type IV pilus modification PilV family protein n=1 Tax=Gallaecimonas sp. GXIMD4217 TaxID=3131927 RepID=UPI00311B4275